LLIINSADFLGLLEEYPVIIDDLAPRDDGDIHYGLSEAAWREAQKVKSHRRVRASSAAALLPEERLEFFARRSGWAGSGRPSSSCCWLSSWPSSCRSTPVCSARSRSARRPGLTLIGGVWSPCASSTGAATAVITNRHLTHHEFEAAPLPRAPGQIPIGQVQTVRDSEAVTAAALMSARVTAAAVAGSVLFDYIDNPLKVKDVARAIDRPLPLSWSAQTQAMMRQSLEKHFGMDAPIKPQDETARHPARPPSGEPPNPAAATLWLARCRGQHHHLSQEHLRAHQAHRRAAGGLDRVGSICRAGPLSGRDALGHRPGRHHRRLWRRAGPHLASGRLAQRRLPVDRPLVIDLDRAPFGFGERASKPPSATSERRRHPTGFFPTLFNYGFVSIDTAGAKSDIVFDYVPNPELIQSDIFQRLDDFRRQQRINEGSARRQEYALLIDVYRQAMEQQRIPPRTPLGYSEEDNQQTP
jgi:hypothetical protein